MTTKKLPLPKWVLPIIKSFALNPDSVAVSVETPVEFIPEQPFGREIIPAQQQHTGEVIITIRGWSKKK